jgi:diaminohydroxyphosphoribosylaminopyrimidine deaminase / 5-amino-6-(5-phosphoribosylamino)uracil reductase
MSSELTNSLLRRAIRLAQRARGAVEPNPMVGCVLTQGDRVIGEGYHASFGGPHAEPAALADCVRRGESPRDSTAYVTLEPCCHTNKKTPPCVPALVAAGVRRVIAGTLDPNPDVDGKGLCLLRDAGVLVERVDASLEAECRQLIAPFLAVTRFRRPYITLKWAETSDRKVAGPGGTPMRITSAASDRVVHGLRARCDALAVGGTTLRNDDPLLTARGVAHSRALRRVVLSRTAQLPAESRLARTASVESPVQVLSLESLTTLVSSGVTHLLIEPGPNLARLLFQRNLVDRVWVFRSPKPEPKSTTISENVPFPAVATTRIGDDQLTEYLNPASEAFFAPVASADFVLAAEQGEVHQHDDADHRERRD